LYIGNVLIRGRFVLEKAAGVCTMVYWLTGLPASGKTALADRLYEYLKSKGLKVERLDGDTLRTMFPETGFSREERNRHVRRAGEYAAKFEKEGAVVVASLISPYRESRAYVRSLCSCFIEVYVNASLATCEKRDPKGLYKKARAGQIKNFTGIDDPYEPPESPDSVIPTDDLTVEESFELLKKCVDRRLKNVDRM
jgi:adenylylsulfate kinase